MEKSFKAFKFRLNPTKKQEIYFQKGMDVTSFVYNYALGEVNDAVDAVRQYVSDSTPEEEWKKFRKDNDLYFNRFSMSRHLSKISSLSKAQKEKYRQILVEKNCSDEAIEHIMGVLEKMNDKYYFLREVPATIRYYALGDLDSAFNMMKANGKYPNFKRKGEVTSYTQQHKPKSNTFEKKSGKYYNYNILSTRGIHNIGKVEVIIHDERFLQILDDIKTVTISRQGGKYYASFMYEVKKPKVKRKRIRIESSVGIDLGVRRKITTSRPKDFNKINYKKYAKDTIKLDEDIKRLQRYLSKKREVNKVGNSYTPSNSYLRIEKKLNKLQQKRMNRRKHQSNIMSHKIVNDPDTDTIILEDLNIKNMTKKSAKGKKNKTGLNRSLTDAGLGELVRQIKYKANDLGKNVVLVDPKYTSQKCNRCGHINKENRKKQDKFQCVECGHKDNADLNAAKNIKEKFFISK